MLEVVFSDSIKESMKIAKKYSKKGIISEDVACIGIFLDIGDISGGIDSIGRQKMFQDLWSYVGFNQEEIEGFFHMQNEETNKLLSSVKDGTPIRIWKSQVPFSACGFAFVCDLLRDIDCEVSHVTLPEYVLKANNVISTYRTWGEVGPGEFQNFLFLEKKLSKTEKFMKANLWQGLKLENSPLRAIVNGKLISVPEDFYDHLIIKNIPQGEFTMASLIGKLLGKYELGIGDSWYALRIEKMIQENKLKILSGTKISRPYEKTLRKVNI